MAATETLFLRVPPDLKRELEAWAQTRGVSVNELAIAYLRRMVESMYEGLAVGGDK